jgi:uncharacterized SAM-binding protein YcdF (DUF218 family)
MSLIKAFLALLLILFCLVAILFVDFAYKTSTMRQREVSTDAIVVLAGGRGRIEEGIRLYRSESTGLLFLVGVDPSVRKSDLFKEKKGERGGEEVFLEKASRNTLENALYSRDLILQKKVGSIRLITSRYHMMRAVLIFRSILPKDIAVYPFPVDSKNLKEKWWSDGGSFRLLLGEFYKYCLFKAFFLFAPGELRSVRGG